MTRRLPIYEAVIQALREHEPDIDMHYEEVNCRCGWLAPDSVGRKTIKDGARDWEDHLRRAVRRAMKDSA